MNEPPRPELTGTPAEFVEALRALRIWSGLTYRQLENKATALADSLPASTIATTLGRAALPRERFVDTFARACGLGEEETELWLRAHRRIAAGEPPPAQEPSADGERAPRRWRRAAGLIGAAGIGAVGAIGVVGLVRDAPAPAGVPAVPVAGLRMPAVGIWARIHPARTPALCVTEGKDRTGGHEIAVAAQRPCGDPDLPLLHLEPVGKGVVQIQWHHPKHGVGCLTVLRTGPGRNLLEPRDDCSGAPDQDFLIELTSPPAPRG